MPFDGGAHGPERETVAGWGSAAALARHGLREAEKKFRA